jgi:GTP-binding protein HflX
VTALNKIDLLADRSQATVLLDEYDRAVLVSALTGEGQPALLAALEHELYERMEPIQVEIPYRDGQLINLFHEHGVVERLDHTRAHVSISGRLRCACWALSSATARPAPGGPNPKPPTEPQPSPVSKIS